VNEEQAYESNRPEVAVEKVDLVTDRTGHPAALPPSAVPDLRSSCCRCAHPVSIPQVPSPRAATLSVLAGFLSECHHVAGFDPDPDPESVRIDMTTKKQKDDARTLVHQFQDHRHYQRLMEAFINFETDEELTEEEQEYLQALEWTLYTLKKQFVMLAAYSTLSNDAKHERAVSVLANELMAIPAKFKTTDEEKPQKPKFRILNGGKS
jgi:hypothetical protein